MRGTATGYDHIPPFADRSPQLKLTTDASASAVSQSSAKAATKKVNSENANLGKGGQTSKQPKNDKTSLSKDSALDARMFEETNIGKGFLVWTGEGNPPEYSVRVQGPGKKGK
jgi:hypothetical protein